MSAEHPDLTCEECGSPYTWYAVKEPFDVNTMVQDADGEWIHATMLHEGRYVCHNYGGCEYAPG